MGTQSVVQDTTLKIAMWLERRLDMSLGFHFPAARLYGIVLNDPLGLVDDTGQAARSSFIDESDDVYELMAGAAGVLVRSFDAAAVVTAGWAAPRAEDGSRAQRASRHPLRRRVRAVAVVSDDGVASLIRFEDDPDELIAQTAAGAGLMVDALEAMWFGTAGLWGDPYEALLRTSDELASTRNCRRRR